MKRTYIRFDDEPTPKEESKNEKNLKKVFKKYPNHDMALIDAAEKNDEKSIKILMNSPKYSYLFGKRDENGKTALMHAAEKGSLEAVKLLIQSNEEVRAQDNEGRTALMLASLNGFSKIVKELVKNGKEVGMQDNQGRNALAYALSRGDIEHFSYKDQKNGERYDSNLAVGVIQAYNPVNGYFQMDTCTATLFNKTNETDSQDINGITPLMRLSAMHCPDLLFKLNKKKLKQLKYDQAFIKDKSGKTAFDYAVEQTKKTKTEEKDDETNLKTLQKFIRDFPQYKQALANQKTKKEKQKAKQGKTNFQDDIGGLIDTYDSMVTAAEDITRGSRNFKNSRDLQGK